MSDLKIHGDVSLFTLPPLSGNWVELYSFINLFYSCNHLSHLFPSPSPPTCQPPNEFSKAKYDLSNFPFISLMHLPDCGLRPSDKLNGKFSLCPIQL